MTLHNPTLLLMPTPRRSALFNAISHPVYYPTLHHTLHYVCPALP